jgi:GNAT superfamily N-acetyltransferase
MPATAFRRALASELALIVAIDDRAAVLFEQVGLSFEHLSSDHPFVIAEHARWRAALLRGDVWLASIGGEVAGFVVLGSVDGSAYLDQLSVLPEWMRRGVGAALIARAFAIREASDRMWLTTYGHVPWNRAYYERFGFVTVAEANCGPELVAVLDAQRDALPMPEQRIAMCRVLSGRWTKS